MSVVDLQSCKEKLEDFRKLELGEQIERFYDLMQWNGQRRRHPKEKPEIMGLRLFELLGQYDMMTNFFCYSIPCVRRVIRIE